MPELPDVEVFGGYLRSRALRQRIRKVSVPEPSILEGRTSPQGLGRRLHGRSLQSTRRHGKNLFVEISGAGGWLRMHFGMTGTLVYQPEHEKEPEHTRLRIDFEDGDRLVFTNQRKLGHISWVRNVAEWVRDRSLGPDALDVDLETFRKRLKGKRGTVKATLMDQGVVAGLGNVYTDEILFQMGLHPRTPLPDLDDERVEELHDTMRRVLRQAIDAGVEDFPDDFLVLHRKAGERCPRCGERLEREEVAGRGTFVCPQEQPAPS